MIKNITIFLLCGTLLFGGYLLNNTINTLESAITLLHIKHKKDILKTKIKERGKRVLTAIPVAGLVAFGWFEKLEYEEWKHDNPDGTPEQYTDEIGDLVYEIAASYYEDIHSDLPYVDSVNEDKRDIILEMGGNNIQTPN